MAALTANASRTLRNTHGATKHTYTIKTDAVIYKHSLVAIDVSVNTALVAASVTTTKFAGLAVENSTGTFPVTGNGTKTIDCYSNLECSVDLKTSTTKGRILWSLFCDHDNQVDYLGTGNGPECGTLTEWTSANNGYVMLGRRALRIGGSASVDTL